ncbi:MAG TPA: hypothetical protein VKZ79_22110 [Alphaproteobacteria bacterium]|nr:hypothetical protein [Alphaproteobacteria bacterium]
MTRPALTIAAALAAAWSLAAWAQDTTDVLPPPSGPEQVPILGESTRSAPASGVSGSLGGSGATGPDSVGTLPQRDTDFDLRTWRDTPFALVLQLIDLVPSRINSAAEHELAKNLLVSVGDAPPGDDGDSKMLLRRVRKLMEMGNLADAAALARAAPGLPQDEALAHAEVEAELLAGQVEAACIDIRAFASTISAQWAQTGLLLCRTAAGEKVEGDLNGIDAEQLGPLARITGAPLTVDPATATPALLVAAARDPRVSADERLEAAFAAGRASALSGEALAAIFAAAPTKADIAADPGAPKDGATAAALFRAIAHQSDLGQKLDLIDQGLLSPDGVLDKVGVAMAGGLRELEAGPNRSAAASRVAMVLYSLGDVDAATSWAELAQQTGSGAALWPYRVLLKQADPMGIADWEQQSGLDPAHRARIVTILSAFGVTSAPSGTEVAAGEDRPEPVIGDLIAMDRAAKQGRVGETVLRALAMLGEGGPATAHPLALRRALADLDLVHLHDEAHALAFEAITATLLGH